MALFLEHQPATAYIGPTLKGLVVFLIGIDSYSIYMFAFLAHRV